MSIHIVSCTERETILVKTRFSTYEVVVLRGDGDVLVRGGRHFTEFERAVFLGSVADGRSFQPLTLDIGFRMRFVVAGGLFTTSEVESVSRCLASDASQRCAQGSEPGGLNATSYERSESA
jgi:hypothetical protein